MFESIKRIWNVVEVRNSILFILGMLVIFRIAAHIPVPGVNAENLAQFFGKNQVLGLINIFSGGGMENFSVVALGVAPYITASIILQLLTMVIPKLEEISQEGQAGQRKINQYTRYLLVPLGAIQAIGLITLIQRSSAQIIPDAGFWGMAIMVLTMVAGTVFLTWIGELITERNLGNGISILILVGIVSSLPTAIQQFVITYDPSQLTTLLLFIGMALITVISIVIMTDAVRKIPVSYARAMRGAQMYGGIDTHLPLRVNHAGVIPIIFAISVVLFPPVIAQFFLSANSPFLVDAAQFVINIFQNTTFYALAYFVLVFAFTYFYTFIIFKPEQVAENLQKQTGFIPGIRPGNATADYLYYVMNRITLVGALFLSLVAILPILSEEITRTQTLVVGGTSLLIVVAVAIEMVNQAQAQLTMRDYDHY